MSDENKAVVRRFVDEIFVDGRLDQVDELVTEDFVWHAQPAPIEGRDGLREAMRRVASGLSDPDFVIEDLVAEGDLVAARLTATARQTGPFMGLPPSGKRYRIEELHLFRVRDGRISEHWHQFDQLGLMRQLGAMPEPAHA